MKKLKLLLRYLGRFFSTLKSKITAVSAGVVILAIAGICISSATRAPEPVKAASAAISSESEVITADVIKLNKSAVNLKVGETDTLLATLSPIGTDEKVEFISSDSSIVEVKDGVITAKGKGTATITALTKSGVKAVCNVTVEEVKAASSAAPASSSKKTSSKPKTNLKQKQAARILRPKNNLMTLRRELYLFRNRIFTTMKQI